MKKSKLFLGVITALALALFGLTACGGEVGTLSAEKRSEIRQVYYEENKEEIDAIKEVTGTEITAETLVTRLDYLGGYNGYDVVLVKLSTVDGLRDVTVTVGGVTVGIFEPAAKIDVYDGESNTLESIYTAYENGKLTKSDLKKIKSVCKKQGYTKESEE